jgi:hypothetical protein
MTAHAYCGSLKILGGTLLAMAHPISDPLQWQCGGHTTEELSCIISPVKVGFATNMFSFSWLGCSL